MIRPLRCTTAALAAAITLAPVLLAAPSTQAPEPLADQGAFIDVVNVEVINVEVYVTDKAGNPVTGLTSDDFQIFEDGRPVTITGFYAEAEKAVGAKHAAQVRDLSIRLYSEAASYAATRGIIIADTKFEFGVDERGEVVLIDEALTPDSSRFWPAAEYRVGVSPPSFDKQFVRDWLETQSWNKKPPAPALPADVLEKTSEKYKEALRLLTA